METAKRPDNSIWTVVLLLFGLDSNRALLAAQKHAHQAAEVEAGVPSLIELALWRVAEDFTAKHPNLQEDRSGKRVSTTIDALAALRIRMIGDLFERLVLPLCAFWVVSNVRHKHISFKASELSPLAQSYLIGARLALGQSLASTDIAALANLSHPLRRCVCFYWQGR